MFRSITRLAPLLAVVTAPVAHAGDFDAQLTACLEESVRPRATAPIIIDAIKAQNARTEGYDQARIDELDLVWRAQVGAADSPMISPMLASPVSGYLREQSAATNGQVTEIILMDAKGLNVAVSEVTSDYWQGDEEKHFLTHAIGPDAIHFGEVEFDQSSQRYQVEVSFTIADPETGTPIGAMTVGVDGEAFM
ncbi:hypothetical protein [Rhodovulum sp.]|uniref:hypothetical protein n=1 Tax=Rhodovulum sp. TaxID=34009 RepID=UPI001838B804|nr:hypothetical protein [Rhodovulum sp.]HDR27629.1 hypothetical protein [Rhodovulum sp.]